DRDEDDESIVRPITAPRIPALLSARLPRISTEEVDSSVEGVDVEEGEEEAVPGTLPLIPAVTVVSASRRGDPVTPVPASLPEVSVPETVLAGQQNGHVKRATAQSNREWRGRNVHIPVKAQVRIE